MSSNKDEDTRIDKIVEIFFEEYKQNIIIS